MKLFKIFVKKNEGDELMPPWIKATKDGRLYIDASDKRYQEYFRSQLDYLGQWTIESGKLVREEESLKFSKPNWRDYV